MSTHEKLLERFLYYWAKMYVANLKIGDKYRNLRKTISIIIVDDEIKQFKEIGKAYTNWRITEQEYNNIILTSYFQIVIIEIPKAIREYQKHSKDEILQWMMFLENPEAKEVVKIMEENEDIKEAKEELDKISQDDILRRQVLRAELERMDYEQCMYEARRDGKAEGEAIGEAKGIKKTQEETALKMLQKQIDIQTIKEITGLTEEEIKKLEAKK